MSAIAIERQAFEDYAKAVGLPVDKYDTAPTTPQILRGRYRSRDVEAAWSAWRARAIEARALLPSIEVLAPDEHDLLIAATVQPPCPHCGSTSIIGQASYNRRTDIYVYKLICTNEKCHASIMANEYGSRDQARRAAVQRWARREDIDRLTKALRDVVAGDWCVTDLQELLGDIT